MVLQNAPKSFNGVVLTVVRGIVRQFDCNVGHIAEINYPLKPLGALAIIFGTVVGINDEFVEIRKPFVKIPPEFLELVNHEIGGNRSNRKPEMALAKRWNENAKWDKRLIGIKIVI